jgi:hypothetical protein
MLHFWGTIYLPRHRQYKFAVANATAALLDAFYD